MEEQKPKGSGMEKIATFIVDKRNLFFLLYAFALIFSIVATGWVKVENDITTYLPEDTETRQGLTVMNDNFVTYGTARVMVSNVTYETAENICSDLESIDGVTSVDFDDTTDHYKSASALFSVTFDGTTTDDISVHALHTIRDMLAGYDTYIDTEVGVDTSADLQSEMSVILVLAAIVIVLVLTLTSRSYAEVPVLIMTFGAAALLNMGTNFLCGTISFISNSVTVILQLALAIDYAIILCHRFSDEHETKDTREACIAALSKAIPEISSSSLTTISGLGALAFMHFGIGRDMATVLIKAILFSLLSVFTLMPGLLMVFSKKIDATRHKNLIPKITFLGKFDVATRFIVPPIFAVVVVVTAVLANKCPYCYSYTDLVTAKQSESQIAHQKIKNTFGVNNMVAVIVPTGDYDSERQLLKDLDSCAEVKSTQGLANIDAMDGYKLADALTPRQMSELAGLDYEVAEALYAAYAVDQNEYGKLISGLGDYKVPLFDMFMFLQREMKDGNITLDGDIQETLDDLFEQLNKAQLQLQSDKYSRLVVYLNLPEESDETMDFLDTMHAMIAKYYSSDTYIVGNSTNVKDLSSSFGEDNMLISVLSALFVVIILLFTFKSAGLPVLLIVVIQGSIWINFSVPTIQHESLYFLGYLIVNSIQMGANIDYAIVISSHYSDLKKEMRPKEAIIAALNEAFPTIFTSGTILAVAGALIGVMTTNPVIAAIGTCLGRGTVISIVLVMAVLPQILLIGDTIVERTSFDVKVPVDLSRVNRTASGNMRVSGRVRGYVNGVIDAEIKGTLNGTLNASVTSGTTIEPTKPDFYLPESKEQAAAEWAENYTEGEEV
ncbi:MULTISPECIES: MMPL family transporter [Gemmiger]|jgi:predicted RND superfamily exporter protein|nr:MULTISPECIES: MMPL family transporter [Gemmiger]MCI6220751.1 MMPL family transporter [Subdoligranulum sp.]MDD6521837.1 MMPL family transporter [Subdoligranulum sp.]MDD6713700.1 MMPL family transporter [Subdoligranulum sp.]MDD6873943.1 MMPL family transporter [Subdoligranulum sp.]MDD7737600.1 MMPL family transporter [Subdoligranulum sp.]